MSDNTGIATSFGMMPLPPCAEAFIRAANKVQRKTRSRIYRKAVRYKKYVDLFAMKAYQNGAKIEETTAPTWGEFDLHDMATSQK